MTALRIVTSSSMILDVVKWQPGQSRPASSTNRSRLARNTVGWARTLSAIRKTTSRVSSAVVPIAGGMEQTTASTALEGRKVGNLLLSSSTAARATTSGTNGSGSAMAWYKVEPRSNPASLASSVHLSTADSRDSLAPFGWRVPRVMASRRRA